MNAYLVALVLAASAVHLSGCVRGPEASLSFTIAASDSEVSQAESFNLTLVMHNRGNGSVRLQKFFSTGVQANAHIYLSGENYSNIYESSVTDSRARNNEDLVVLRPGGTRTKVVEIQELQWLKPGEYALNATYNPTHRGEITKSYWTGVLQSNSVRFTLVAAQDGETPDSGVLGAYEEESIKIP